MSAALSGRDSLVVLPTGGGKSLCYQAPAVATGKTTVVVSPLISLMKDQVDSLRAIGIEALQIDSMQSEQERRQARSRILAGDVPLVYVSPSRLLLSSFQDLLHRVEVASFVIDEAHCISHWGHDFWPEYRRLHEIRSLFPQAALHAFTATATERVRRDIVEQLRLRDPEVLVGDFDRPNLTYRVVPRYQLTEQVCEVIERHQGEAGIIYCIRRKDVESLADELKSRGYDAVAYHAGLSNETRKLAQERFSSERSDIIVATVAFGMGIDRSNVRFVMHTGMPKSIEHYQQETGRAGRDGLEAECLLLYSGADPILWKSIVERSASEREVSPEVVHSSFRHIDDMSGFCRSAICRHRALVAYFGQKYLNDSCRACDLCLGETAMVPDGQTIAQKILSCVARTQQRFGVTHIVEVLRGSNTEKIRSLGHDQLSTFGLLREKSKEEIRDWVYQLVSDGIIDQEGIEYPVLRLNGASREVMKGNKLVSLAQMVIRKRERADGVSWQGVDRGLFETLRQLRRRTAEEKGFAPFIVFSDATLREIARVRPATLERLRTVSGVGDVKLRTYGEQFVNAVNEYYLSHPVPEGEGIGDLPVRAISVSPERRPTAERLLAMRMFSEGASIEAVIAATQRTRGTVFGYLADFVNERIPPSLLPWVSEDTRLRVEECARRVGTDRLKPIFAGLDEEVGYEEIRVVLARMATRIATAGALAPDHSQLPS